MSEPSMPWRRPSVPAGMLGRTRGYDLQGPVGVIVAPYDGYVSVVGLSETMEERIKGRLNYRLGSGLAPRLHVGVQQERCASIRGRGFVGKVIQVR